MVVIIIIYYIFAFLRTILDFQLALTCWQLLESFQTQFGILPGTCCEKFTSLLVKIWALGMFSLGYVFLRFFEPHIVSMIEILKNGMTSASTDSK